MGELLTFLPAFLFLWQFCGCCDSSVNVLPQLVDPGNPLILTPYIEKGQISQAQKLSQVGALKGTNIKMYSGFLTVNTKYDSNMYFWFIPAKTNSSKAPVLLWLQGGPGGSSLFALFNENGPFYITKDKQLVEKKVTWQSKYSMLYIDNPVGTGFSYTKNDLGYARNQTDVANDLYSALTQFFTLFPEYQKNDFYTTGESYAGKYVPAISYKIHKENPSAKLKINFKGMIIGDGLCDPESMFPVYPKFMFQTGLIDENQNTFIESEWQKASKYIQEKNWKECFNVFDYLLNGDIYPYPSYFTNASGLTYYFNYLADKQPEEFGYYGDYVILPEVRKAIHVGNLSFDDGSMVVEMHLLDDICQSVKPWFEELVDHYRVLMYSGQLDIIVAAPLTENFLMSIKWKGQESYSKAKRLVWKINKADTGVAGYVRIADNLFQVIVRGAGHILPYDQPERAFDMIDRFISGKPFTN